MPWLPDASHLPSVTPKINRRNEELDTRPLAGQAPQTDPRDHGKPRRWTVNLGSLWSKPSVAKATLSLIVFAQMLGWMPGIRAAGPPTAPSPAPPNPDSLIAMRRGLRELDRFLDHHPLLEDRLRLEPELARNLAFLEKNPELREFLEGDPDAAAGLKIYPRYFLYRALLRQSSGPLSYTEISQLKEVFTEDPNLERQLKERPESIRDPAFLKTHPPLLQFLQRHPTLARVFIHKVDTP